MTIDFYGQQDGERVLYAVKPHTSVQVVGLVKVGGAALMLLVLFLVLATAVADYAWLLRVLGLLLAVVTGVGGWWLTVVVEHKNVTYITDRRVVRFSATNPWFVTTRATGWDEVVKVKTEVRSWWMRMLNIGTVIVHARSTVAPLVSREEKGHEVRATDDDVHIEDVEYYRDLGNYLDKLLFTYKREPEKLGSLREFVPKPRGKRY